MVPSNEGAESGTLGSSERSDKEAALENVLEQYEVLFQTAVQKPWVIPVPKGNLQRIFGTSQVFHVYDAPKSKVTGLTVPLKLREYFYRGQRCLEQEDWELGVLFCSRALHLDSELVDFYALRAEAYIQLCDFSSAVQNLRRAYSDQPENTVYLERLAFVLYLQGQCLYEQCEFQDALSIFLQASDLQPEKSCFRYRCMACLLALKRHHDCLVLATKEVQQGTSNPDVFVLRARLYNSFQKPSLCYQDLHSALLLNPKHLQARQLLQKMVEQAQQARYDAGILAVQGKLQHALLCISCAIENNPLDPSFFLFRGTMYRRLGQFDAAMEDLLKALDMVTSSQEDIVQQVQRQLLLTYNDFAVCCYMQGAYQEGVLLLNKALKEEQREKGLYLNRGDCFFQLGNLTFAEADYRQALALTPEDEGANMRMGLLQERLGFCEQRRRQFQKAEDHFSAAIQHNPQEPQYYLYRAKSRRLLQDVFGARQDLATVLLLNPNQPKLITLMTNLFPGMSAEDIVRSQVGQLAKIQLERMLESSQQPSSLEGVVGPLRVRALERLRAQALSLSWKLDEPLVETSEGPRASPQDLDMEPKGIVEEAKATEMEEKAKEEKVEPGYLKVPSLTDSYVEQSSSASFLDFTVPTSETETSSLGQEYQSSSTAAVMSSESSVLRTESSQPHQDGKDHGLSHTPRKTKASRGPQPQSSSIQATQAPTQKASETEATQGSILKASKTKVTQGPTRKASKTKVTRGPQKVSRPKVTQGPTRKASKTKVTQDPTQKKASRMEATQGPTQKASQTKVTQGSTPKASTMEATRGPKRRFRKAKTAHGWSAVGAKGQSLGLLRSSCRTESFYYPDWTQVTEGLSWGQSASSGSSETKGAHSSSPSPQPEPASTARAGTHSPSRSPQPGEADQEPALL
ncbi:tetratricopeptide repeat protein 16 [Ochotona princeps]|uniref:tetratricopeptide repeat protein 16 n=1 Tax=Ochotona princeps TaxID=9978 RepID=UPI0027151DA5|nr:tetratricopeptide repeat protein 16 [Ochotona princeps]